MTAKNTDLKVDEDSIFEDFCTVRGLSDGSIYLYKVALQKYVEFTGKNLEELIDEAEEEEDLGIRLRKRKIHKYLTEFKKHLDGTDYSTTYKQQIMVSIKALYNEYDIQLPRPKRRKSRKDKKIETIDDLPTMEEIQTYIDHANSTYKAIAVMGLSSGMGMAEIASLTFKHFYDSIPLKRYPETILEIIDKVSEKGDLIPLWRIKRIKTGHPYFTFSSPESVDKILSYLEDLHRNHPDFKPKLEDTLFRNVFQNEALQKRSMGSMYYNICKKCNMRITNGKVVVRSHSLRKYFATTMEKNKVPHLMTRWLMGHTIDPTSNAYFKADPEALREEYVEVVNQLTTNAVEVKVINKYEEVQRLQEEQDKLKREMELIKKLQSNPEYLEEVRHRK